MKRYELTIDGDPNFRRKYRSYDAAVRAAADLGKPENVFKIRDLVDNSVSIIGGCK